MKDLFEKIVQAQQDLRLCTLTIDTTEREARGVIDAVAERLSAERAQGEARAVELSEIINDSGRPETARRMAQSELDTIRARELGPTVIEKEAFDDTLRELATAAQDAEDTRKKLKGYLTEAQKTIGEALKDCTDKEYWDIKLSLGAADRLRQDFEAMLARVGAEVQK